MRLECNPKGPCGGHGESVHCDVEDHMYAYGQQSRSICCHDNVQTVREKLGLCLVGVHILSVNVVQDSHTVYFH